MCILAAMGAPVAPPRQLLAARALRAIKGIERVEAAALQGEGWEGRLQLE